MTKNYSKILTLLVVSAAASLMLAVGGVQSVYATGNVPSGTIAAGAKPRLNNAVQGAHPLDKSAKGAKVFGMDSAATLVTDEAGVAPTAGGLAAIEISNMVGGTAQCYALVYDSSVAADTTEAGSVSRLLVPPLIAVTSDLKSKEFLYPKQFNKGLVVLLGGTSAGCRASIGWLTNGGAD